MAPGECGKVLALLSLSSVLLLLADALPFRHHGPSPVIADLLLAALARLDGVSLLDLATRRNMILLCHAILLVLLGDAGILGIPARRRRQRQGREATAAATTAASACCYYYYSPAPPEQRSAVVVWQQSSSAAAAFAAPSSSLTEPEHELQVAEDHMSDKRMVALAAELVDQPGSSMDPMMDAGRAVAFDEQEEETSCSSRSMEDGQPAGHQHVEEEEEEDLDEMNRRFEAFIAATKEKMRLEAMQQPVGGKTGALLVAR
jgi:hypothetical protein